MKARLPQGMGGGGAANLQQLARQAQKMQEQMEQITTELEAKEYTAAAGGGAVSATVTGKMEVKNIDIKPEVIDPDDAEMLGDLVAAAVNEALRAAANEKEEKLGAISGGMSLPGIRHASDNVADCVLNERSNGGDEFLCLRRGFVHFPVAGDNSLSNSLVHDFLFLSVG